MVYNTGQEAEEVLDAREKVELKNEDVIGISFNQ